MPEPRAPAEVPAGDVAGRRGRRVQAGRAIAPAMEVPKDRIAYVRIPYVRIPRLRTHHVSIRYVRMAG